MNLGSVRFFAFVAFIGSLLSILAQLSCEQNQPVAGLEELCESGKLLLYSHIGIYALVGSSLILLSSSIAFTLFGVFATLISGELLLRSYEIYLDRDFPVGEGEAIVWSYDKSRGWKNSPGATGTFVSQSERLKVPIKINSKGLRDDEYDYEKPKDTFRVLVLGDSLVEGPAVSREQLLDLDLERRLANHGAVQVINAGTAGYGTDQSFLYYLQDGVEYKADLVIYVFSDSDPIDNITIHKANRKFGKPYFEVTEDGKFELRGVPVPTEFEPFSQWQMTVPAAQERYNSFGTGEDVTIDQPAPPPTRLFDHLRRDLGSSRLFRDGGRWLRNNPQVREYAGKIGLSLDAPTDEVPAPEEAWVVTEQLLLAMKKLAAEKQTKFLVFEAGNGILPPVGATRLQGICERANISYLEAFDRFAGRAPEGDSFWLGDRRHWSARGYAEAASVIYDKLVALEWLPGSTKLAEAGETVENPTSQ